MTLEDIPHGTGNEAHSGREKETGGSLPVDKNNPNTGEDNAAPPEVKFWLNDREVEAAAGSYLIDVCRSYGVDVPTLCYLPGISRSGVCRVCLVEVEAGGRRSLQAACVYPVSEGIKVYTDTPRVRRARRRVVELMLSEHQRECLTCVRNLNCELQELAERLGIRRLRVEGERLRRPVETANPFIVRDPNKCIKCRRCVAACRNVQDIGVIGPQGRGFTMTIGPAFEGELTASRCIACGQCVLACPTGALVEREYIDEVWAALENPEKFVIVQTAPAIPVTIGEAFGLEPGQVVRGQLAAALRRIGFDRVFTTELAADLTIVEEAHELLHRLDGKGPLPLISSCSPGWVRFCELFYPEFVPYLSSCKSPMEMLGALSKTYYAEKIKLDPQRMVVVAVMPCTAKKFEAARPEHTTRGLRDVDYVLTTRELARMIRQAGLDFPHLAPEEYDQPLGLATGAGAIFAATGGVMEAAIRTAYALVHGSEPAHIDFYVFRGLKGIKIAEITMRNRRLRLAVAHGTRNARRVLEMIKRGEKLHFVEIMGCPGGCIGGGGQPLLGRLSRREAGADAVRMKRAEAVYHVDLTRRERRAHENPAVKQIYAEFLGYPLSPLAREILHVERRPERTRTTAGS